MRIGIVGNGIVGQATARSFIEHCDEVLIYDKLPERCADSLYNVLGCDLVFVCLPTPQKSDGLEADLSVIDTFFQSVSDNNYTNFVLKSTVPIGTTKRLVQQYGIRLVHSPEFLTARCAILDAQIPSRNIIGRPTIEKLEVLECAHLLDILYKRRWPHIPIHFMKSDESEAVKLFQNSFFAVKVAFWNEIYTVVEKYGMNWDNIRNAILADGRIHPSHTQVPGPDNKKGFGGTCLPKDLANLMTCGDKVGAKMAVCLAAHIRNKYDRERNM